MVFWITAVVYAIGVVFFFFAMSGEKQPWADGTDAVHKEDVPYSNTGKTSNRAAEEKKPLLEEEAAGSNQEPGAAGSNQQAGDRK